MKQRFFGLGLCLVDNNLGLQKNRKNIFFMLWLLTHQAPRNKMVIIFTHGVLWRVHFGFQASTLAL